MTFRREKISDLFLKETSVENMFINEYMATASGDCIKVYLMAQMYADANMEITNEEIAKSLGIEHEDVLKAWTYWEKKGIIRKIYGDGNDRLKYDVEFINLKEALYGSKSAAASKPSIQSSMADEDIQKMLSSIEQISGNVMNGSEMAEIISWVNDYNVPPEVVVYGYKYCIDRKKKNIKYIEAVIRNWADEGLVDVESIERKLSQEDKKHYLYQRVFKALGFNRNSTEEEKRIMDTWFEDMGFTIDKVLEACGKTSGIASPNINYVNKVLCNWYEEKTSPSGPNKDGDVTTGEIARYYEILRERKEEEAEERRRQVFAKVPRIKEIEDELSASASKMTKLIISDKANKQQAIDDLKSHTDTLNIEEAFLLTDNGYEINHMEVQYDCELCHDTGMLDTGEKCQCFGEVTRKKIDLILKASQKK